jgi:mono/diheme cytochrome c family protein
MNAKPECARPVSAGARRSLARLDPTMQTNATNTMNTAKATGRTTALAFGALALLGGVALLGGCRGERSDSPPRQFFPDMDDGPKWKPQGKSDFYEDGRTMRPVVTGAVPWGRDPSAKSEDRSDFLREDKAFYQGVDAKGEYLWKLPTNVPVNAGLLARGQERYNVSCAACHGYYGDGKGTVGTVWSYPLPNFHDEKYKPSTDPKATENTRRDGYIFHVIRNGVPGATDGGMKMPGYAYSISPRDAWAIVLYVRALQETRAGKPSDLPPELQAELERVLRAKPGAAGSGSPATAPAGAPPAASPAPAKPGAPEKKS